MNCSSLDIVFPGKVIGSIETPSAIVLNAVPTILSSLIFILFLLTMQPRKRILPVSVCIFLAFLCISATEFLLVRLFELMECNDELELIPFKFLILILFPIISFILLVAISYRNYYRLVTLAFILFAVGFVLSDYYVRKDMKKDVAQPLFPMQTFMCICALSCLIAGKYTPISLSWFSNTTTRPTFSSPQPSSSSLGKEYCVQPNSLDPTSRHPTESKGVGSAPQFRSVWN